MTRTNNETESAKERILEAALLEFSEYGYSGASTRAIAQRAGVAVGLPYHHFSDKDTLYLEVFRRAADRYTGLILERYVPSEDFFDCIERIGEAKLRLFAEDGPMCTYLLDSVVHAPRHLQERIRAVSASVSDDRMPEFLSLVDDSGFLPHIDSEMAKRVVTAVCEQLCAQIVDRYRVGEIDEFQVFSVGTQEVAEYLDHFRTIYGAGGGT